MGTRLVPPLPPAASRLPNSFSVEWDPRFLEEAVLRAAETRQLMGFRGERNRLYEIDDPEQRETAFREFHAVWFERLDLGRVIRLSLHEQPLISTSTRACIVVHARGSRDEGAELFVSPGGEGTGEVERRSVGIRLDPRRLLDEERLLVFLRHELFHIADMLDTAFGYQPRLPPAELGPAHERLLQDRYRVLWDTYIDGRLLRQGKAPASVRNRRLQEFMRVFPMHPDRVGEAFARFFDSPSLTHADLVSFSTNPTRRISSFQFPVSNLAAGTGHSFTPGDRCPLCGFPTHAFEPNTEDLSAAVVTRIRTDYPGWSPRVGLCQQCADLYRS